MTEEEGKGFKVVDRRSFTPDGERRADDPPADAAVEPPTVEERLKEKERRQRARDAARTGEAPPATGPLPRIDFTTFVFSLGSSVLIHLGEAPLPDTGELAPNLELAHETIDILGMIEEKTRGNLTPEEEQFLQTLLYDLRLRYVQATRQAS